MVAGERVSWIVSRATTAPEASSTTARRRIAPTARIADCGGFITAEKLSIPNIPRFETVNVAPGQLRPA